MFAFDELDEQEAAAAQRDAEASCFIDFSALDAAEREQQPSEKEDLTACTQTEVSKRCAFERDRSSYIRQRQGPTGLFFRLALPRSVAELCHLGAQWLTRALQRARTLPEGVVVSEILATRPVAQGGASQLIDVAFSPPRDPPFLVVHFFQDGSSQAKSLEGILRSKLCDSSFVSGINFLRLLESELDVPPRFFFGDVCDGGGSGLLITEWSRVPSASTSFCPEPSWTPQPQQQCYIMPDSRATLCLSDMTGFASPFASMPALPGAASVGLETIQTWQAAKDHHRSWTLISCSVASHERLWRIRSSRGALLVAQSGSSLALSPPAKPPFERAEFWTLLPGTSPESYYIRSFYDSYLTHATASGLVSLGPGRGPKARWTIQTRTDWLLEEIWQTPCPLDVRGDGLSLDTMKELMVNFAKLSGRCAEHVVVLEPLEEASSAEDAPSPAATRAQYAKEPGTLLEQAAATQLRRLERQGFDSPRAALGFQDSNFLDKASAAQEFIARLAVGVFPRGAINKQAMKDYRAALVTARVNGFGIRNFLQTQWGYKAIGLDFLGVDSLYHTTTDGLPRLAIREWDTMTDGPLGYKIWRWLLLAQPEILLDSLENLLEVFITTFAKHGDQQLDREALLWHVLLAAALQSVELLDAVPLLLEKIPREGWQSMKSLEDPRLHDDDGRASQLWLTVKAFVHIALVTQRYALVARLEKGAPEIFATSMLIQNNRGGGNKHLTPYFLKSDGAHELRANATETSELLALLPPGTPGCAVLATHEQEMVMTGSAQGWAQLALPIPGFVDLAALHLCSWTDLPTANDEVQPEFEFLALMYHTRRQYTGSNGPLFMDEISAKKLHDEILTREKVSRMVTRLGLGSASVVHGSFLASTERMPWWPSAYQDWAYHSFILFEDGTIADITADLFDTSVPQLWFPADSARYDRSSHRAEEARFARQVLVGLDNWRQSVLDHRAKSQARRSESRAPYDWWDAEMKGGFDVRNGQSGQVLRHGKTLPLPSPTRVVSAAGRRVIFRRLTGEEELDVTLVEGLFEPFELEKLLGFCEQRQGFTASLQKDKQGHVVQDGRRTSESCAMLWPMLCESSTETEEELAAAEEASLRCAQALGVEAFYCLPGFP
eukprot:s2276_g4.t1